MNCIEEIRVRWIGFDNCYNFYILCCDGCDINLEPRGSGFLFRVFDEGDSSNCTIPAAFFIFKIVLFCYK